MNRYEDLTTRFEVLDATLSALGGFALDQEQEETAARIEALRAKAADRVFRVAVAGEFSTGKSALINALLGEELLPTGLEACTAVVTRIRRALPGEEPGVSVRFRKSGLERVDRDQLREHLTFEGKAGDDAPLEAVVALPAGTLLDHGIELVDTPGVNDPDARGEQVTLGFLPQADAIIFLTHAARAFKESELEFLRDRIGDQDRDRVLFVVNACDLLEEKEDFDDLRSRAATVLGELFESPRVHLASARDGLRARQDREADGWGASGMQSFSEDLDRLLTQERGAAELERFRSHAARFREDLARRLEDRIQTLGMDDAIRLRRCERVRERLAVLEQEERDILRRAESGFEGVREAAFTTLGGELTVLHGKLEGMESSGKEGSHNDIKAAVERIVGSAGSRALTKVQSSMRSSVERLQAQLATQMNTSIGQIEAEFQEDGQALVKLESPSWDGLITVNTDRYVQDREEEEEVKNEVPASSQEGGELMGMGLGGMIGLALLGPWGLLAGGIFGLGAGSAIADTAQPGRKLIKTVREWFVSQKVDADRTVAGVREQIEVGVQPALETLLERTRHDVRRVFSTKVGEFRDRLADLEEPTREVAEQEVLRQRAEAMLEKLRQVPVTVEGE